MDEILDILREDVVFIATIDGDKPRLRPFGAAIEYEDNIYLFTSNTKEVYRQIVKNPNIEIVVMLGQDWARISAKAYPEPKAEIIEKFLQDDPELKAFYSVDDGKSTPLRLEITEAVIHSETAESRQIALKS